MRLDKFLCEVNRASRSRARDMIRRGLATVNGLPVRDPAAQVDETADCVCLCGQKLSFQRFHYYMLNKPSGFVCAVRDEASVTVLELLEPEDRHPGLFPAGRLDKDTEGFLLLTDDGALAHRLLAPKRHVDKTYLAAVERELSPEELERLALGVDIGEARLTLPARVQSLGAKELLLTIHEGKFHQVKRMLQAVGNGVTALKRVSFGGLSLDAGLKPGEYRELTEDEVRTLYEA